MIVGLQSVEQTTSSHTEPQTSRPKMGKTIEAIQSLQPTLPDSQKVILQQKLDNPFFRFVLINQFLSQWRTLIQTLKTDKSPNAEVLEHLPNPDTDLSIPQEHTLNVLQKAIMEADSEYRLTREATSDGLTGLYNRKTFDRYLNYLTKNLKNTDNDSDFLGFAVITIDMDFLKKINDQYGHLAGDQAIQALASRLKQQAIRTDHGVDALDLLAVNRSQDNNQETTLTPAAEFRTGGEEFIMLVPFIKTEKLIDLKAKNVQQSLFSSFANRFKDIATSLSITINNQTVPISFSAAMTIWTNENIMKSNPVKETDQLLYQAKAKGRARLIYPSPYTNKQIQIIFNSEKKSTPPTPSPLPAN